MGLSHAVWPHLGEFHLHSTTRKLPCSLRSRQATANDPDDISHQLGFRYLHGIATRFVETTSGAAGPLGHFFHEDRRAALRAWSFHGTVPGGKFTIGIAVTTIEDLSPTRLSLFQISFPAFRALNSKIHRFFERADVLTFRIPAAAEEFTVFSPA